jgi:arylsulfatase A
MNDQTASTHGPEIDYLFANVDLTVSLTNSFTSLGRNMVWTATLLLVALGQLAFANEARAKRPNIILIMADDIGYECYGSYGGTSYSTPNLDRMAAGGMRFNHCYSQPLCTPSRVKIMTGLSNVRNYAAFSILKRDQKTFGRMFLQAGCRTAIAGKWQLYGAKHYRKEFRAKGALPEEMGFERHCLWQVDQLGDRYWGPLVTIDGKLKQFDKNKYGPDVYCQFLLDRMEEYRDEPFFLYYPMALVHSPFQPTPDSANKKSKNKQQNFGDMVAYMDKLIGRLVDKTVELGIDDNTLVLVNGDNGTHSSIRSKMGDVEVRGGKGKPTDAGTRVALIAYQPGYVPAGRVTNRLVEFSDFIPTLAALSGASLPGSTDGVSFLPTLQGKESAARRPIHIYYWPRPEKGKPLTFVRNQRWKLYGDGRLFDVENDVLEASPINGRDEVRKALQTSLDSMPAKGQTLLRYD